MWNVVDGTHTFKSDGFIKRSKVAAFDFDDTLVTKKTGVVMKGMVEALKLWYEMDYCVVVFTNQTYALSSSERASKLRKKIEVFVEVVSVPLMVCMATTHRKPQPTMWLEDAALSTTGKGCFFVGDAAGRVYNGVKKDDFSAADICFALNLGVDFYTPEQFLVLSDLAASNNSYVESRQKALGKCKLGRVQLPFRPERTSGRGILLPSNLAKNKTQEVILLVGLPASGKSTLAAAIIAKNKSYVAIGNDRRTMSLFKSSIDDGKSVIVDNTNSTVAQRKTVVDKLNKWNFQGPVRCLYIIATFAQCMHNNAYRNMFNASKPLPDIAIKKIRSIFVAPTTSEGFDDILCYEPKYLEEGVVGSEYFMYLNEKVYT